MQIRLNTYASPYTALAVVRSTIDEIPAYHGKVYSYTLIDSAYPAIDGCHVYLNKKEVK